MSIGDSILQIASIARCVSEAVTGDRYCFMPDGKSLVVTQGMLWLQNFSLLDLASGKQGPLTNLIQQIVMKSFDVSPDGKQILYDCYRGSADLVLRRRADEVL